MLKNLLVWFMAAMLSLTLAFAQPPNPTTAPNFTLTDMNNVQQDMYSYLDQGVTVILDIWATWCGPCISSIPHLETIWNQHGFSATGDSTVMIFSLEIDPTTSNEAAMISQHGIHNPVFNNGHTIENLGYNTGSLPTFYVVCPDREYFSQIGGLSSPNSLLTGVSACRPLPNTSVDLRTSFNWYTGEDEFCGGEGITPRMWIKNMGTTTITSFDLEVGQGGMALGSTSWSGSLARFESANIEFDRIGAFNSTAIVDLTLKNPNGMTDEAPLDNAFQIQARKVQTWDSLNYTLWFTTDNNASELSWEIVDHRGVQIAQGGNTGSTPPYFNNSPVQEQVTLPGGGCYELIIYDSGSDGWNFNPQTGAGTMLMQPTGTRDVVASLDGSSFSTADAKIKFEVSGTYTNIDDQKFVSDLTVYPNPFSNEAWVSFDMLKSDRVQISLIDVTGKQVMTRDLGQMATGTQEVNISGANLPAGLYFLNVQVGTEQITRKVSIK